MVKYFSIMLIITLFSGCSAIETSTQIYQLCKYQDKCPVEVLGDWLNGPVQIKLNVKIEYIIVKENRVKNVNGVL